MRIVVLGSFGNNNDGLNVCVVADVAETIMPDVKGRTVEHDVPFSEAFKVAAKSAADVEEQADMSGAVGLSDVVFDGGDHQSVFVFQHGLVGQRCVGDTFVVSIEHQSQVEGVGPSRVNTGALDIFARPTLGLNDVHAEVQHINS